MESVSFGSLFLHLVRLSCVYFSLQNLWQIHKGSNHRVAHAEAATVLKWVWGERSQMLARRSGPEGTGDSQRDLTGLADVQSTGQPIGAQTGNIDDHCCLLGLQKGDEGISLVHNILLVLATEQGQ